MLPNGSNPRTREIPRAGRVLFDEHRREIVEGSGVAPELVEGRYFTVTAAEALALGFSKKQARDGWAVELTSPAGEVSYQLKPNRPRAEEKDGKLKAIKYETRAGHDNVLDVHPSNFARLMDPAVDILVGEGTKKGDCAASRRVVAVSLTGVWNWGKKRKRGGTKYGRPELLPDWDYVPLEGRKVCICFDADYREKRSVALAIMRLAERLMERGARVHVVSLPGPEKGLDDFVVAGGDLEELLAGARPYQACDLTPYVATQDRKVVQTVEAYRRRMARDTWEGRAGKTDHSYMRAVLELTLERGRWVGDGVEVVAPTRELQERAAIGSRTTLAKKDERLVEREYLAKQAGNHKTGQANRYILKAPQLDHLIGKEGPTPYVVSVTGPVTSVYVPHLRWPAPPAPEDAPRRGPSTPLCALGKAAEFALDRLLDWGGRSSVADLATAAGYSDASKFRADVLEDLAGSGVVALDEKRQRRAEVCISPAWRESLDARREASGEFAKARMKAVQNRKSREEHCNPTKADPEPELMGPEWNAKINADAAERDHAARVEDQRRKVGTTAAVFLADALQGVAGFGWRELCNMWAERGGRVEDLWREARDPESPYRLHREDADRQLYVERVESIKTTPKKGEAAAVVPMRPDPSGRPDDLRKPQIAAAPVDGENLSKPDTGDPRDVFRNNPLHAPKTNPHTSRGMLTNDDTGEAPRPLPPKGYSKNAGGDGVHLHGPYCSCWICGDDSEAAPAEALEVGASA